MSFYIDENGDITLVQGDSGIFVLNGLPTDKNYSVYFAIQDKKRNPVGGEICITANKSPYVEFRLTSDFTDLLKVPKNESVEHYYYGLKICDSEGYEETLTIGDKDIGDMNIITVYSKKVEGAV